MNRVVFSVSFIYLSIVGLFNAQNSVVGRSVLILVLLCFMVSSFLDWRAEAKQLAILTKYSEVNNIPAIRLSLHKLNNQLMFYQGLVELQTTHFSTEEKEAIIEIERAIYFNLQTIQHNVHEMDPSYTITKGDRQHAASQK